MLKRYRFKTRTVKDFRPLKDMSRVNMPWWCTGESFNGDYVTIVCYLPEDEDLLKYWDDAFDIESDEVEKIVYSSRFPKPDWVKDDSNTDALFETKKTRCPKCRKELIRLAPYSTKGVSEFWCDDCNIKITIDDKTRDKLNTELSSVDLLELTVMKLDETKFSAKDLFPKAIKKQATQDSNLNVQYNVGDADADNLVISESFAKKRLAEVTPEIAKSTQEVLSSKWVYDEQKRDSDER